MTVRWYAVSDADKQYLYALEAERAPTKNEARAGLADFLFNRGQASPSWLAGSAWRVADEEETDGEGMDDYECLGDWEDNTPYSVGPETREGFYSMVLGTGIVLEGKKRTFKVSPQVTFMLERILIRPDHVPPAPWWTRAMRLLRWVRVPWLDWLHEDEHLWWRFMLTRPVEGMLARELRRREASVLGRVMVLDIRTQPGISEVLDAGGVPAAMFDGSSFITLSSRPTPKTGIIEVDLGGVGGPLTMVLFGRGFQ